MTRMWFGFGVLIELLWYMCSIVNTLPKKHNKFIYLCGYLMATKQCTLGAYIVIQDGEGSLIQQIRSQSPKT